MEKGLKPQKINTSDYFTIPNILCYIRIILIPVFMFVYLNATTTKDYYIAAFIILFSGITDFCDGYIARKFNQVTDLGKFLDPLADKLTQGAIILTLMFKIKWMNYLVGLFIVKELFMAVNGAILLTKKGRKLDGAKWFGKVSTAVLYASMFILIIFPSLNPIKTNLTIGITAFFMLLSFLLYIPVFIKMYKD